MLPEQSSSGYNVILFYSLVLSSAGPNPICAITSQIGNISTTKPSVTLLDSSVSDHVNATHPPTNGIHVCLFVGLEDSEIQAPRPPLWQSLNHKKS